MNPLIPEIVGSFIRAVLTILSGWLVAHHVWTQGQSETFTTYLVSTITAALIAGAPAMLAFLLSVWQKIVQRRKLVNALASPVPQSEALLESKIANGVYTASISTPKTTIPSP